MKLNLLVVRSPKNDGRTTGYRVESTRSSKFQEVETKNDGARFAFNVKWKDPMTGVVWKYQLFFFTHDNSIEMFDIKNHRLFLRRVAYPDINLEHLFIGSIVNVFTRQLLIEEYGDEFTRRNLQQLQERTLALIKPDGVPNLGKIIEAICCSGLLIRKLRMCKLSYSQAKDFYAAHEGQPYFEELAEHMSSAPVVAMELVAEDAIAKWKLLIGPTSTEVARMKAPSSLRAQFGTDCTRNAVHGSSTYESAAKEGHFFFADRSLYPCAKYFNVTLGVIKPHTVAAGAAGAMIDLIQEKYEITAMEMMSFTRPNAEEFYELYRGVVPDYYAMTHELSSGEAIAMELSSKECPENNPVKCFREFCGPPDPLLARQLRPESVRAQFGVNKVKNGIHCTDLPEDGELECKFMFNHQWTTY
ncbi:hypothetical protein R1sor_018760 [Riccia sorocarpa]|uniref:DM10 domain-containing protein n=1 Tax=Riccia sorocarpa TaxID=122646 RepID=A0ABD3IAN7_9MARC